MSKIIINQFHSGSAYGDAVTNSLFYTQRDRKKKKTQERKKERELETKVRK